MTKADDFGQLCWELYCYKTKDSSYQLYKDKKQLLSATYIIHEGDNLEFCSGWIKVSFFGVQNARVGFAAVCELAKGHFCSVNLYRTFRWEKSDIEGQHRCRNGWELFILPANKLYDGNCEEVVKSLPPYEDERFEYSLDLGISNYFYSLTWVDGVYTFQGNCYSKKDIEIFKNVFPELPAKVTGNAKTGWKIVVQITSLQEGQSND